MVPPFYLNLLSLLLWFLTFLTFFILMRGLQIPVSLIQTLLGATASVVASFLPIGGIGSFGTVETGWALGFKLVGLESSLAITSGISVSLLTFSFATVLGILGGVNLWVISRKRKGELNAQAFESSTPH